MMDSKINKDKREPEYPVELESQFVLRLPKEPAKVLREVLKTGENLKNRLTIQIENDMRHGEVRFDHWLMHAKIVDLPTVIESLKTIDNKSFYKTADIAQMMICKEEPDQPSIEEESPAKNKKKDPNKVDKKFLWPHGVTPPTKNVRKRRFRKTLKKKYAEAPEIEKEVKRLLRADNEAVSVAWDIIKEEDAEQNPKPEHSALPIKPEKKSKADRANKREATSTVTNPEASNVVDIFGGAVSDSDLEDDNIVELGDSHLSAYDSRLSDADSMQGFNNMNSRKDTLPTEFHTQMFPSKHSSRRSETATSTSGYKPGAMSPEEDKIDDNDYSSRDMSKDNMTFRIEELKAEVEELKQRRLRTKLEMAGIENSALRQRFQDILHTLNQDIMFKEMEYQGMITLQNSDDI